MKNNNLIIIATLLLFFACGLFLSYTGTKALDYGNSKTWWTAYFNNPASNDLSFTIENHSGSDSFQWEAFFNGTSVTKGAVNIPNNHNKEINIPNMDTQGKTNIVISSGNTKKEIYKNL